MNMYLAVLVGMLFIQSAFADSDVLSGRAHFNGTLVNSGCSLTQESNLKRLDPTHEHNLLKLYVSNCSSSIYHNLKFELAEATQENRHTEYNLAPSTYLQHSIGQFERLKNADELLPSQVELSSINETVALPLTFTSGSLPQNSKNILLSVFYP